jgi:hypothetical protein
VQLEARTKRIRIQAGMKLAATWWAIQESPAMMMTRNTTQPAPHSDIVESELQDMLQTLIDARCGLSAIHQLLDGAQTMSDLRTRFAQWQTSQCAAKSQQTAASPNKLPNGTNEPDPRWSHWPGRA